MGVTCTGGNGDRTVFDAFAWPERATSDPV